PCGQMGLKSIEALLAADRFARRRTLRSEPMAPDGTLSARTPVMASHQQCILHRRLSYFVWLFLLIGLAPLLSTAAFALDRGAVSENPTPEALEKPFPENLEDLKAIQAQVQAVVKNVLPC